MKHSLDVSRLLNVGFVSLTLPAGDYTSETGNTVSMYTTTNPNGMIGKIVWNLVPRMPGIPTGYYMGDTGSTPNNAIHFNQTVDMFKNVSIQVEGFDIWGNSTGFCPAYYEESPHINNAGVFGISKIRLTCSWIGFGAFPTRIAIRIIH